MCVSLPDRYHGLVPAEWLSAGLIRPRPQTQSLIHGLPELHVPVRGFERLTGAERLLEVEFHQPHVEFPQKQVSSDVICQFAPFGCWCASTAKYSVYIATCCLSNAASIMGPGGTWSVRAVLNTECLDTCWTASDRFSKGNDGWSVTDHFFCVTPTLCRCRITNKTWKCFNI